MVIASIVTDPGSFVAWLVAGLLAGLLASFLLQAPSYGMPGDVVLGVIGGLIGGLLFGLIWDSGSAFWLSIPVAFIAGCLCIAGGRCLAAFRNA